MSKPSPADLLRFMAREESLVRTLEAFPDLDRADLASLLERAADALEQSPRQKRTARGVAQAALPLGEPSPGPAPRPQEPTPPRRKEQARPPEPTAAPPSEPAARPVAKAPAGGAPKSETAPQRPVRRVPAGHFDRLRVYSDGAARGNPGPAGAGAVLVAPDGRIVERLGRYLGINTNNYAEYKGLLLGLERAHALGAREVEVFADSELLIRQLAGTYKVKAENLKPLFQEAQALLRRFDRVRLVHVPREQNQEADEMSNRAIDERM